MRMSTKGICNVEGCRTPIKARGMCGKHYQRVKAEENKTNPCGCGCGELTAYKYVQGHHTRLFTSEEQSRRGQMNDGKTQRDRFEGVSTHYRKVRGRHEHRIVMERVLGRKLTYDDVVHHKDGNKRNNHPDNLEVMTRADHIAEHREGMVNAQKRKSARIPK